MDAQNIQKFELPSVVDVDVMDTLREWLLDAIEHGSIKLDGSKVSRIATNALLLLVSAGKDAKENQFSFQIANPSEALAEAIQRLGMGEIFAGIIEGN